MSDIDAGIELIKQFEGLKLHAYPDPGTGGAPWTIGYGQTGPDIVEGTVWTAERAETELRTKAGLLGFQIERDIPSIPLTDNQLSAMISFAYNLGIGTLMHVIHLEGLKAFPAVMLNYVHAGERIMPGLVLRRQAERNLFLRK